MAEDLDKLREQVESELALLSGLLYAPVPQPASERASWAVREELNELWFEGLAPVAMPLEVGAHVRGALQEELRRAASEEGREYHRPVAFQYSSRLGRCAAALAAAAMIALCVGVIRYGSQYGPLARPVAQPPGVLELFVAAGMRVQQEDVLAVGLADDISDLEEAVTEIAPPRDRVEDRLERINEALENLFMEPEPLRITS